MAAVARGAAAGGLHVLLHVRMHVVTVGLCLQLSPGLLVLALLYGCIQASASSCTHICAGQQWPTTLPLPQIWGPLESC